MCDVRAIRLAQVAWVGWRRYCPPTDTAWKIAATLIEAADEIDRVVASRESDDYGPGKLTQG